jgi:FHS family L-fucose permease-like MFS transporter
VAVIFKFSSIPNKIEMVTDEADNGNPKDLSKKSALDYPQLVLGMIAIFLYVGVEVSTASNLPEFMKQHLNIETNKIAPFVSLFWASLMIGRWTSSVGAFNLKMGSKKVLQFFMPYIAFLVFLLINIIANNDITPFYIYSVIILVLIVGDIMSKGNPATQLLIYSVFGIIALFIGMISSGMVSVFAFISVGLFCSTLWPCIFTLAICGLGKYTNQGSSFLIMMIMGGGVISLLQGFLSSNNLLGIQWSYLVGVCCFAYLAFYALKVKAILKSQNVAIADNSTISH